MNLRLDSRGLRLRITAEEARVLLDQGELIQDLAFPPRGLRVILSRSSIPGQ